MKRNASKKRIQEYLNERLTLSIFKANEKHEIWEPVDIILRNTATSIHIRPLNHYNYGLDRSL